jgi:8-oxo-dGTP pyrophosphatase MutT (NUDIX family)
MAWIENDNEFLEQAVKREVREETGLEVSDRHR